MSRQLFLAALLAAATAGIASRTHLRPWIYQWGADDATIEAVLLGDDWVAASSPRIDRAITIDARGEMVWPWLAQIGEDRGGFIRRRAQQTYRRRIDEFTSRHGAASAGRAVDRGPIRGE